jgi:histidinol-phosphate aminotransferase
VLDERRFVIAGLAERGLTCSPSQANFLLVRVEDPARARERLARGGILVRDGAGVGFPGHLRISLGTRDVNERVLKLLED